MPRKLKINVVCQDAFTIGVDVLILKYAQNLYGADKAGSERLSNAGIELQGPSEKDFAFQKTFASMTPRWVLFVGVAPLHKFTYAEIRDFSRRALTFLASNASETRTIALTLHGPGYGLDEIEAFESEFAGIVEAISNGKFPSSLEEISFVEFDSGRAARLTQALQTLLPKGYLPADERGSIAGFDILARKTLGSAGYASSAKPHVFVAMPFATEMDDVFHYGIQGAVNAAGLLCERADLSAFTGDVVDWVKQRISSATLVIADLSTANPNVYLEVGYAWGKQVPTVLLVRDASDLKFDTKGQRCLLYKSIKNLEELLRGELRKILGRA